jgi:hypothetical protein
VCCEARACCHVVSARGAHSHLVLWQQVCSVICCSPQVIFDINMPPLLVVCCWLCLCRGRSAQYDSDGLGYFQPLGDMGDGHSDNDPHRSLFTLK